MSLVYFNFLFIQTIKRRPVWVTWILFLFAIACFLIILPAASGIETLQLWANTTVSFAQTIMAMIAGVFTAILAINIFRDTQEEGTELIVISKPITRNKIVLTKFLVFGFVCLIVNITAVILTSFTILLPQTEKTYFAGLVVSMFIGNAVVFAVMGAISILTSVKWAKIGVIVTNLLIVLILLIFQILASFVFKTPMQALKDKDAAVSSYIYIQRDMETGEYVEKNLVDFSATNKSIKHAEDKAVTWQDVDQFWKEDIKGIDPSDTLNATDIASQFALTYSSHDLHKFSKRQAKRMFGMSRYYDYNLVKPISPENIGIDSNVCWLWSWPQHINTPDESKQHICDLPGSFMIPVIESYDVDTLKGMTNKLPIGVLRSNEGLFGINVFLEPDEWQKYKEGFDQIYNNAFDYSIKAHDVTNPEERYYDLTIFQWQDWTQAPFLNTKNFNLLYQLIWHFFMGDADKFITLKDDPLDPDYYNIRSVTDLNIRFAQFKYYLMFKIYEEEQNFLNVKPENAEMIRIAQDEYLKLKDKTILGQPDWTYEKFLGVKIYDPPREDSDDFKGFYMECAKDENGEYVQDGVLTPGTRVPCYEWIWRICKQVPDRDYDNELVRTSPRNRFCFASRIINDFLDGRNRYLYDSLEAPTRSNKFTLIMNNDRNRWYVNPDCYILKILGIPSGISSSTSFFEYTMTSRTKNWIFVIVWGLIAMAGYAAGSVIYKKYDVK